jgi:hypothetical protein
MTLFRMRDVELSSLATGAGRPHSLTLVEPRSASPVAPLAKGVGVERPRVAARGRHATYHATRRCEEAADAH